MAIYNTRNGNVEGKGVFLKRRQKWKRTTIVATLASFAAIQSIFLETNTLVNAFVQPTGKCTSGVTSLKVLQSPMREDTPTTSSVKIETVNIDSEENDSPVVAEIVYDDESSNKPLFSSVWLLMYFKRYLRQFEIAFFHNILFLLWQYSFPSLI